MVWYFRCFSSVQFSWFLPRIVCDRKCRLHLYVSPCPLLSRLLKVKMGKKKKERRQSQKSHLPTINQITDFSFTFYDFKIHIWFLVLFFILIFLLFWFYRAYECVSAFCVSVIWTKKFLNTRTEICMYRSVAFWLARDWNLLLLLLYDTFFPFFSRWYLAFLCYFFLFLFLFFSVVMQKSLSAIWIVQKIYISKQFDMIFRTLYALKREKKTDFMPNKL